MRQAADPEGRGRYLCACFQQIQASLGIDAPRLLKAAYAAVLSGGADLAPDAGAVQAAADGVMDVARTVAASGARLRTVLIAARRAAGPMHAVMAPRDRAARLLLAQPHPVWQAALAPHMPPYARGFVGIDGCRQLLDAALASAFGMPAGR
ncbi:hypothetical protein DQ384_34125 [Sphaerisporangium album]|uniref:Uncharacterized protein n=1 Tax=Sphaerisporangium album TaxID=509200 RepID=A0A367F1P6_9ACTN|nr:hypothetical protein [Sphaerisporangium album]RCG23400.1 hypothetical protein DQ384_34125 [Sphaerisporangium album]